MILLGDKMTREQNSNNQFSIILSGYSTVGFHATNSIASGEIEKVGIFPNKVFDSGDHQTILAEGKSLGIDVSWYG